MNQNTFNNILRKYEIKKVEKHLIYTYINQKRIEYTNCYILNEYLHNFIKEDELYLLIHHLNINTIKDLENYLELLIPVQDRKINGAFFTPTYIVDFIIQEIKPKLHEKNLDPSCGCGAFLIGIAEYYRKTYNKTIKLTLKENIFGADILEYNILRTKLLLCIYALQNDEIIEESDFNLYIQDSLKAQWNTTFDNIVGNPPYVKFQDLPIENRNYLLQNWETIGKGSFNLYFAFFELGYKLLNKNGQLGYITPNNYFTSLAGEPIRKFFQQKKCIKRIIDFSYRKVFNVQTYTALTFLQKTEQEFLLFDRIKDEYSPAQYLCITSGSPNFYKNLNFKKWRLLKTDELENINQIETVGSPIGKLFDICVGIATLKDEVFFVDDIIEKGNCYIKVTKNGEYEIEKEITKPVYKISDFKSQQDIYSNHKRIIYPYYTINNNTIIIPEEEFSKRYPKCYKYLLSEKDILLSRDKGKIKYTPFYIWGRTQGLNKFGKKILTPTFSQVPRFMKVDEENSFFTNGYGLFFKTQNTILSLFDEKNNPIASIENMDVLQKILNSSIMHYYIIKTSIAIDGGYPCYQKNFIEKFSIPFLSDAEIKALRQLNTLQEIDEFLLDKYQLNLSIQNLSL